jgi:hypothetical protein
VSNISLVPNAAFVGSLTGEAAIFKPFLRRQETAPMIMALVVADDFGPLTRSN